MIEFAKAINQTIINNIEGIQLFAEFSKNIPFLMKDDFFKTINPSNMLIFLKIDGSIKQVTNNYSEIYKRTCELNEVYPNLIVRGMSEMLIDALPEIFDRSLIEVSLPANYSPKTNTGALFEEFDHNTSLDRVLKRHNTLLDARIESHLDREIIVRIASKINYSNSLWLVTNSLNKARRI